MTAKICWKRIILFVVVFFSLVFSVTMTAFALTNYSDSLADFVRQDRILNIDLYRGTEFSFSGEEEITVSGLEEEIENMLGVDVSGLSSLKREQIYTIKPLDEKITCWIIQIFASQSKETIERIKENLIGEGFEHLNIIEENEYYKIQKGPFLNEEEVNQSAEKLRQEGWQLWIIEEDFTREGKLLGIFDEEDNLLGTGKNITLSGVLIIDEQRYPGFFDFSYEADNVRVINRVSIDTILAGKLEYRLSGHRVYDNERAYKTGAVIYRSSIMKQVADKSSLAVNLSDYRGYSGENDLIEKAVKQTRGQVIEQNGKIADETGKIYSVMRDLIASENEYRQVLASFFPEKRVVDLSQQTMQEVLFDAEVFFGMKYKRIEAIDWAGRRSFTLLDVDMNRGRFKVEPLLARDRITGKERLLDMVMRKGALAAVNGGYFDGSGQPLGLIVKDGVVVSEPIYERSALIFTKEDDVLIERLGWEGFLNENIKINGVNRKPGDDELVVINKYFGEKSPEVEKSGRILVVEAGKVQEIYHGSMSPGVPIPDDGFLIMAPGEASGRISQLLSGSNVEINNYFKGGDKDIRSALGAGPRLLRDGEIEITAEAEQFRSDISEGRAPRSAVGITEDNHLIFVTVDGRQPGFSIGFSLEELAQLLKDLGIKDAVNLDGGDSAGMVVRRFIVNNPRYERLLGSGIIITLDR